MFSVCDSADRAGRQGLRRSRGGFPSPKLRFRQRQILLVLPTPLRFWHLCSSGLSSRGLASRISFAPNHSAVGQTTIRTNDILSCSPALSTTARCYLSYRDCFFLGSSRCTCRP